jgi:hypothetical protein
VFIEVSMLRSVFPRAHQKYFSLPLLGPITDGFDDWLAASGFTLGSRTLAINLLPIADRVRIPRGPHAWQPGGTAVDRDHRRAACGHTQALFALSETGAGL